MHDDNGIKWPVSIAPYQAIVVAANYKNEQQTAEAEKLYDALNAGVKFKDADLIGIPVRVVVGKKVGEGIVEYKERTMDSAVEMSIDEAVSKVIEFVTANK